MLRFAHQRVNRYYEGKVGRDEIPLSMAIPKTRYLGKKVSLQLLTDDKPWSGTVTAIFREADELYYTIENDGCQPTNVNIGAIAWISVFKEPFTRKLYLVR